MIAVTVQLRGILRDRLPGLPATGISRSFERPIAVGELIFQLGLPPGAVALVAVNGSRVEFDHQLADGDQVLLLPQAAGG